MDMMGWLKEVFNLKARNAWIILLTGVGIIAVNLQPLSILPKIDGTATGWGSLAIVIGGAVLLVIAVEWGMSKVQSHQAAAEKQRKLTERYDAEQAEGLKNLPLLDTSEKEILAFVMTTEETQRFRVNRVTAEIQSLRAKKIIDLPVGTTGGDVWFVQDKIWDSREELLKKFPKPSGLPLPFQGGSGRRI